MNLHVFFRRTVILMLTAFVLPLTAQVNVSVQGATGNDTLLFRNMTGSPELKKQIQRDLACCGWFDMVASGVSTYIADASGAGSNITISLYDGAGNFIMKSAGTGRTPADASHKAVDGLLQKLYKVPGICCSRIAFSVAIGKVRKEIYVCDYDGQNIRQISNLGGLAVEPCFTPDGKSVVYSFIGNTFTALVEYDFARSQMRQLARFRGLNAGGAVSPDGQKIALVLSKDNQVDLYVRNLNGGPLKRLTNDRAVEASPCWSPDGRNLCYVSDAGSGRPRLRIISAYGGRSRPLPGILGSESVTPRWSKDGKITYGAKLGSYTVCVLDTGSGTDRNPQQQFGVVTKGGGRWEAPSWAPDNRHVVCIHNSGLWIVDTWTCRARQLVGGRSKCFQPAWSDILR